MKPFIICEHVDFGYENHDAVIDLNLEICQGDYLCVVGENGSGKSTLVKGLRGTKKGRHRLSAPADGGPERFPGHGL